MFLHVSNSPSPHTIYNTSQVEIDVWNGFTLAHYVGCVSWLSAPYSTRPKVAWHYTLRLEFHRAQVQGVVLCYQGQIYIRKRPKMVWHYALNPGLHSPQFQGVMLCYQGHRCDEGEFWRVSRRVSNLQPSLKRPNPNFPAATIAL